MIIESCSYRTVEGRVKPVYFSADAVVFTDTVPQVQTVLYQNLMGLSYPCLEVVDLHEGKAARAFIARPTFFQKENREFLVYPRENIFITANASDDYIPAFATINKNNVRDGELQVLKIFHDLERGPQVPRLAEYTFQTILDIEEDLKEKIAPAERASQLLFDSLCTAFQVSQKFIKLTKDYVHNRYDLTVLGLYEVYRDTLKAHNVYYSKIRAMLPQMNALTKINQFNLNVEAYTNYLYASLFPNNGIRNMANRGEFQACFDSIATNFRGPARDYLLSRLMYRAIEPGFRIPPNYRKQYRHYSMNKSYRKIIRRVSRSYKHLQKEASVLPNQY